MERFDQLFITIAQETGGIQGLLHSFFSFLIRRTDFFYEADPGDNMGFPPGVAEKMVLQVFHSFQQEYYKKQPKKSPEDYKKKLEAFTKMKKEQEMMQKQVLEKKQSQNQEKQINLTDNNKSEQQQQNQEKQLVEKKDEKIIQQQDKIFEKEIKQLENIVEKENTIEETKLVNPKEDTNIPISIYNGGKTNQYSWSQSVKDVTVAFKLSRKVKSKEMQVEIQSEHLKIIDKIQKQTIIDGELYDKIRAEDSAWTLEDEGHSIILHLEKLDENVWKTIIKGDDEIDASKVDNTKKLEDFDPETQGALRKVMYEQDRKQRGLLTTEEEQQQEMLKKAWNAPGSPFQGTPFDPNKVNIPSNQNFSFPNNQFIKNNLKNIVNQIQSQKLFSRFFSAFKIFKKC